MKICVAQTKPVPGDINSNIKNHKKLIQLAVDNETDMIIFPELSLTGYEPAFAKGLATTQEDTRLDDFQEISNASKLTIGVGLPTNNDAGICISMVIFQPHKQRQTYSKKYIHADEEPFFISGENIPFLKVNEKKIAMAICYELSVPEHAENASKSGAELYIASVAKTASGVGKAYKRLSEIAVEYSMTVLMANCIGPSGDGDCAGKTAIWNNKGICIRQLEEYGEGILMIDTDTQQIVIKSIHNKRNV